MLWLIPAAVGAISAGLNAGSASKQADSNMAIARFQASANEQLLQKQLDYNLPKNQMSRYKDAGLNPNLIYGNGSSSAGNQEAPLRYPDVRPADYQSRFSQLLPQLLQTAMTQSQVSALDARTRKDTVVTDLNRLQAQVVARNPLLNDSAFSAIIDGLRSTAEIKATESQQGALNLQMTQATYGWQVQKLQKEVDLLEQRFRLGELDGKLKAEVLKSKEFQNAILEVQKKFLADGSVGPAQIYQFITLLLMKAL